jgi:hypothetical protein
MAEKQNGACQEIRREEFFSLIAVPGVYVMACAPVSSGKLMLWSGPLNFAIAWPSFPFS